MSMENQQRLSFPLKTIAFKFEIREFRVRRCLDSKCLFAQNNEKFLFHFSDSGYWCYFNFEFFYLRILMSFWIPPTGFSAILRTNTTNFQELVWSQLNNFKKNSFQLIYPTTRTPRLASHVNLIRSSTSFGFLWNMLLVNMLCGTICIK